MPRPPLRAGRVPSSARASATVAGRRPDVERQLARLGDELAVRARHRAVGEVEVVLEPDAHRSAERQRGGDEHPLRARDPDHAPVRARRQVVGHRARLRAVAGTPPTTPMTNRRAAARDSRPMSTSGASDPTWPVSKHSCSGLIPQLVHRLEQRDDLVERVGEDPWNTNALRAASTSRSSSSPCSARRPPAAAREVRDALLDAHADGAGRVVDDHLVADLGEDRLGDRAEVLDRVGSACRPGGGRGCGSSRRPRRRSGAPRRRTRPACTGSPGTGRGWPARPRSRR